MLSFLQEAKGAGQHLGLLRILFALSEMKASLQRGLTREQGRRTRKRSGSRFMIFSGIALSNFSRAFAVFRNTRKLARRPGQFSRPTELESVRGRELRRIRRFRPAKNLGAGWRSRSAISGSGR